MKNVQKWNDLSKLFDGNIFGMDKKIDYRQDGSFAVYVQLKSGNYEDQKFYIIQNRDKIITWLLSEMSNKTQLMKRIGFIGWYELSNITLLRCSMIEFLFSLKHELLEKERVQDENI